MNENRDCACDVLVVGGGMAGCLAALCAARAGARTILAERLMCLGGMATSGLVQPITMWGRCTAGTGWKLLEGLHQRSGGEGAQPMGSYGPCCDAEWLKRELEERLLEAGVEIIYQLWAAGVERADGRITAVQFTTKGGPFTVRPRQVIDASGDADVAALAGVPWDEGRQGTTLMMEIAGIDRDRVPKEIGPVWKPHNDINHRGFLVFWHPSRRDAGYFNMSTVDGRDMLDPRELTAVMVECRRQCWRILELARRVVPGFERAYMAQTAPTLGVRETRRIRGLCTLVEEDVLIGRDFADGIARAISPVDVHGPPGTGKLYFALKRSYGIPWRCLVARECANLVVAGRPISADHVAHSSLRRMATGCALGEAAGLGAMQALHGDGDVRRLDTARLREALRANGAILDADPAEPPQGDGRRPPSLNATSPG